MEETTERNNKTITLNFNVSKNTKLESLIDGAKEIEDCLTYILGADYLGNLCFEEVARMNVITSHRANDLKDPVDYIRCRTKSDKETLQKWQLFFLQKDVPFRTIIRDNELILQKDFKRYSVEELERMGWNIKDRSK